MRERRSLDRLAAEDWIASHVAPAGEIEVAHDRPWATVLRVPTAQGNVWFKACGPVQRFEPRLTRELCMRWPDTVAEVLACDEQRAWIITADAGTPLGMRGNQPSDWLEILPRYARLQIGEAEAAHVDEHLAHGVPDLRLGSLPKRYQDLLAGDLPVDPEEGEQFRSLAPRFTDLCRQLDRYAIPASIQHDDLHIANVYEKNGRLRVLDWGDASIAPPFASLFVTFRFLEGRNGLSPDDPWFAILRDAYLEPWGDGLNGAFDLGVRVGAVAHAIAWVRQRSYLTETDLPTFDVGFKNILRRALRAMEELPV
jgi:hypothetical protein